MSYSKNHHEGECDRCLKNVGKKNLKEVPFLYCDYNDNIHEDVSWIIGPQVKGYRQYYVCKKCYDEIFRSF